MVRALARELDEKLRGARLRGLVFDSDTRVHLVTAVGTLTVDLHPQNGTFQFTNESIDTEHGAPLPGQARIHRVSAPPDERLLLFEIGGRHAGGSIRRLVIELITNQWNAIAIRENERISRVLRARGGARPLEARARYAPPPPTGRAGADHLLSQDEWTRALAPIPAAERPAFALREIAWTSPLNIDWIFGTGSESATAAFEAAYARYVGLVNAQGGAHYEAAGGIMPYVAGAAPAVRTFETLLDAIAALAVPGRVTAEQIEALLERERKKLRRLHAQADDAAQEAATLRERASLLLAYSGTIRRGADRAVLMNASGENLEIVLDPAVTAVENANGMFDEARRRERAAERVPELIAQSESRVAELERLYARTAAGEDVTDEVGAHAPVRKVRVGPERKLPYRRYRTSGGLEVRVGRNARANDELTLRHTSPTDIWMHARDVGGAHVVLRWQDRENNPPRQDLIEAAVLAALHSRSRTSSTVAVDWTRRKYVRKPRKAAPGSVMIERAQTVFVEPDESLEKKLRAEAAQEP